MKKSELIKIIREAIKEAETVGLGKDKSGCPKNFQCKKIVTVLNLMIKSVVTMNVKEGVVCVGVIILKKARDLIKRI